jgi:hypothetical protein
MCLCHCVVLSLLYFFPLFFLNKKKLFGTCLGLHNIWSDDVVGLFGRCFPSGENHSDAG